jgi:hypothetical protein
MALAHFVTFVPLWLANKFFAPWHLCVRFFMYA